MDYPRPQLRRRDWTSLDGSWQFNLDNACRFNRPSEVPYDRQIEVPYAPEAPLSGIGDTSFHRRAWYKRAVELSAWRSGKRHIVHFGAVDYHARVFVDDQFVCEHRGGHVPFQVDVTDFLSSDRFELALVADDDPADMHKPRGKQDWELEPHGIWYPRTTGIWRTVWLESVSTAHIGAIEWRPDVPRWQIALRVKVEGYREGMRVRTTLKLAEKTLVIDEATLYNGMLERVMVLPDGGIDDARDNWMWSPEHPQLIDAEVILLDSAGTELDRVQSYTALRTVTTEDGRFMLNSRSYALRMVLDQGYWPDGLMTASSAKLKADVQLIKRLGFNGARKHQKIEDPRWLYWCDVLGLAVWAEMPSPYAFSSDTVTRMHDEWRAAVERDLSHPCVIAWVPVNESWGVPELPNDSRQRALVRSLVGFNSCARRHSTCGWQRRLGNSWRRSREHPRLSRRPGSHHPAIRNRRSGSGYAQTRAARTAKVADRRF